MGNVIQTTVTDISNVDLRWMVGRTITSCEFHEPTLWIFALSGGGHIHTESVWRLRAADRMRVCSADHGHEFGLPARLDASVSVVRETASSVITDARIDGAVPDLILSFANGLELEVLALSLGYESWQVCDPVGVCFVVHGSRHAQTWRNPKL